MGILDIVNLHLRFGGVAVLQSANMEIEEGTIFSIIGPNGAGKTSLLNCINGLYRPQSGEIIFKGINIASMACYKIARLGVARTFQNIELFKNMSVLDNLLLGYHNQINCGPLAGGFFWGRGQAKETEARTRVEEIIDFLEMEKWRKNIISQVPFGILKRVELGRALVSRPKILLLDEPTSGMNAEETEDYVRFILDVFEEQRGITIILIEHDMHVVMDISHRICVLNFGVKIAEGTPSDIQNDPGVKEAYLGE